MQFEGGTYYHTGAGNPLQKYYGGGYANTRKVIKSTTFDAPCSVEINAKDGYSFTVYYSNNGVITGNSGLVTTFTMKAGNQYGITLRATDGTTDISSIAVDDIVDIKYDDVVGVMLDYIKSYNCFDYIDNYSRKDVTSNGIHFEWDGSKCHVYGTATAFAMCNIFYSEPESFPDWMETGKTYYVTFNGTNTTLQIWFYKDHQYYTGKGYHSDSSFTVPSDADGCLIRLVVNNGVTLDEYVDVGLTNTYSNERLLSLVTNIALQYNSYNTLLEVNGTDGTYNGVTFSWDAPNASVSIVGEASPSTAFRNLFFNQNRLPDGIEAGKKYLLVLKGNTNSGFRIGFYNGSTSLSAETYTSDAQIEVPSNATGMYIRAQVESGVTVNDNVQYALLNAPTNTTLGETCAEMSESLTGLLNKRLFESAKYSLPDGTDLNDVQGNMCYSLTDTYTYLNSPIISGFLLVYNPSTLNLQIAVRYSSPTDVYIRRKLTSQTTWSDWVKVPTANTYNVTNTFTNQENTYNVTATPNITTDTNNYLSSTGDTTDRTTDIVTMLSTTGVCRLGPGSFYVKNLVMPNNTSIMGSGRATRITLANDDDSSFAIKMGSYCTVSDLWVYGQGASITSESVLGTRHGILWQGTYTSNQTAPSRGVVSDVFVSSFSGGAISCMDTGTPIANHIEVCNAEINNCGAGIYIPYSSEFNKFTNVTCNSCLYGCVNNGGNNMFVNCCFSGSKSIGFLMDNENGAATNNSHGSAIGCLINHTNNNTGIGIKVINCANGYIFDSCQIFYSQIYLEDAAGIVISNSNFGYSNTNITIKNGGAILFTGNMHGGTPSITIENNNNVTFSHCYVRTTGAEIGA